MFIIREPSIVTCDNCCSVTVLKNGTVLVVSVFVYSVKSVAAVDH